MLFEHLRFTSHAHAVFLCFVFVLVLVFFFSVDDYRTECGVWIGLNDVTGSGSYEWEHNTTLFYTKWANGEPDRRYNIQYCVTIKDDGSGHWEDINCYHHLPFICQKNA